MRCSKCNKKTKNLYYDTTVYSLTEGVCEDCIDEINNEDDKLLEAIKEGKSLDEFLD